MTRRRNWWSAGEIAAAALPGMPGTCQGVQAMAKRHGWRCNPAIARRRKGKGGGWEYNWKAIVALREMADRAVAEVIKQIAETKDKAAAERAAAALCKTWSRAGDEAKRRFVEEAEAELRILLSGIGTGEP